MRWFKNNIILRHVIVKVKIPFYPNFRQVFLNKS